MSEEEERRNTTAAGEATKVDSPEAQTNGVSQDESNKLRRRSVVLAAPSGSELELEAHDHESKPKR